MDNLYCYIWQGMGNNCNTYLIAGEVPTLIDPGHVINEFREPCLEQLLSSMREDGFEAEDITLVINTHVHPDHSQANRSIIAASKAKLAFHKESQELMRRMQERTGAGPEGFQADFYLDEGDLNLGKTNELKLNVFHTPGHSPDSLCLYWPEEKALITGDLIFALSVGRTDIGGGSFPQLTQSIERMAELDIEYLLPGHMGILEGKVRVERNFVYIRSVYLP